MTGKPAHQHQSFCPSGEPSLVGPACAEPRGHFPCLYGIAVLNSRSCRDNTCPSLLTSFADITALPRLTRAYCPSVCVHLPGTQSDKASAPTSVLLSIRRTFFSRSRMRRAERSLPLSLWNCRAQQPKLSRQHLSVSSHFICRHHCLAPTHQGLLSIRLRSLTRYTKR